MYTHYWYRKEVLNRDKFRKAIKDVRQICKSVMEDEGIPLVYEYNQEDRPVHFHCDEEVRFNGPGDNGHETFLVQRKFSINEHSSSDDNGRFFSCCKTSRKDYDLAVTACLIVFNHYFDEDFRITSDGDNDEWQDARSVCQKVLGYELNFVLPADELVDEFVNA